MHFAFVGVVFIASLGLTYLMIRFEPLQDIPNERSSHTKPVPKSGGVGIVAAFSVASVAIYFIAGVARVDDQYFWPFLLCGMTLAFISLVDDVTQRSFLAKIIAQVTCVLIMLGFGVTLTKLWIPSFGEVALGQWGYILTFLWIIGMTNAFNFMDGLDGLAGGVGFITACFMCGLAWSQGSYFVYIASFALAASIAGFVVFNFPPAKIFMGDVGSAYLGFVFASLAVIGASFDYGRLSFYIVPMLLFHFIFDTFLTFLRRGIRGERVYLAHRTHLYQLINRMGFSHRTVSLFHYAIAISQGIGATILVNLPPSQRLGVFVPFVVFQSIYAFLVLQRARRLGLI